MKLKEVAGAVFGGLLIVAVALILVLDSRVEEPGNPQDINHTPAPVSRTQCEICVQYGPDGVCTDTSPIVVYR